MQKKTKIKIIFIITAILFSVQVFSPSKIEARDLNWNNPNAGKSAYQFKLSDYLNSQMMMSVVGCTGVVNKIAGILQDIVSLNIKDLKIRIYNTKISIRNTLCFMNETILEASLGVIPTLNLAPTGDSAGNFCEIKKQNDKGSQMVTDRLLDLEKEKKVREECLNGIAFTLAKNQLTAMTKSTMNWITTGFNGDPMYVRNINSFMRNIENGIFQKELDMFKDLEGNFNTRDYPYGRDFSIAATNARQSSQNFADSMKQDLTYYLKDGATIEDFKQDFSKGGWGGWLALTQHPQNNPLGHTAEEIGRAHV